MTQVSHTRTSKYGKRFSAGRGRTTICTNCGYKTLLVTETFSPRGMIRRVHCWNCGHTKEKRRGSMEL